MRDDRDSGHHRRMSMPSRAGAMQADGHRAPLLGELQVAEDELVGADRYLEVRQRRRADRPAVEQDLGPWNGIHVKRAVRKVQRDTQ